MKIFINFCMIVLATILTQQSYVMTQPRPSSTTSAEPSRLVEQAKKKYERRDFTGAMADLNQVIKANPKYAKAYNGRGILKFVQKDWKGAMIDYNMSINLDPKYANAYSNRGLLKLYQGDFNNASIDLNLAIDLDPTLANAYKNRGLMFVQLGKKEVAIKDFQRAAQLYDAQGDKESARQSLEAIKKLNRAKV